MRRGEKVDLQHVELLDTHFFKTGLCISNHILLRYIAWHPSSDYLRVDGEMGLLVQLTNHDFGPSIKTRSVDRRNAVRKKDVKDLCGGFIGMEVRWWASGRTDVSTAED
jgi:hypothetical protein